MSRPHICFIQSQCVPWGEPAGSLRWLAAPGVQLKILSSDSDDESITAVVRVPPGFQRPWASRPGQYLEMLMLDDNWTLEESGHPPVLLGPHGYLRLAASGDHARQVHASSDRRAVRAVGQRDGLLSFHSRVRWPLAKPFFRATRVLFLAPGVPAELATASARHCARC